jgi:peptidoglycan hydrolase-like protein with peptidoglycan-binding domain
MRKRLSKLTQAGVVLAAIATSAMIVPAASAQSSSHKKSGTSTKSSAASHSTTEHTATSSPAAKTASKASSAKTGKSSGKKSSKPKKVKGQAAPTPDRINEIQEALAKKGAFAGAPTGKWDDSTVEAMKNFQASNHLSASGKIDAPTLQKLGLGSETAGVGAPTPPPNSTANRLLSRNAPRDPDPTDN